MAEGIIGSFGGKVAEQWSSELFTPAFAFWAGGLTLWFVQDDNWAWLRDRFGSAPQSRLIVLGVGGLLTVAASATIAQKFEPQVIAFLEGYGWWPERLRAWLIERASSRFINAMAVHNALLSKGLAGRITGKEQRRFAAATETMRRIPPNSAECMPTSLGNILRSSEAASDWRYGLDTSVCWPRLWGLLPDGTKKDLADARSDLNAGARVWLWGVLFLLWSGVSLWAIPAALTVCVTAYFLMKQAARAYGDLVQATFDVYRPALYKAIRREMAKNAADEREIGLALSRYLAQGSDDVDFVFTAPADGNGS